MFIKPEEADLKTNIRFIIIKRIIFRPKGHTGSNILTRKIFIIYKRKHFHNLFYQNNPFNQASYTTYEYFIALIQLKSKVRTQSDTKSNLINNLTWPA